MPMDNALNISELLKRLGVVGDSKASAPLLEGLQMGVHLADFSQLVAPLSGPITGSFRTQSSAFGLFNAWSLASHAVGGLIVHECQTNSNAIFSIWVSDTDPFPAAAPIEPNGQFAFGQVGVSQFRSTSGVFLPEPGKITTRGANIALIIRGANWIGPGQFFNIQSTRSNQNNEHMSIVWREYPAALNPR